MFPREREPGRQTATRCTTSVCCRARGGRGRTAYLPAVYVVRPDWRVRFPTAERAPSFARAARGALRSDPGVRVPRATGRAHGLPGRSGSGGLLGSDPIHAAPVHAPSYARKSRWQRATRAPFKLALLRDSRVTWQVRPAARRASHHGALSPERSPAGAPAGAVARPLFSRRWAVKRRAWAQEEGASLWL